MNLTDDYTPEAVKAILEKLPPYSFPVCDICGQSTLLNMAYQSPDRVVCVVCWRRIEKAQFVPEASPVAWW